MAVKRREFQVIFVPRSTNASVFASLCETLRESLLFGCGRQRATSRLSPPLGLGRAAFFVAFVFSFGFCIRWSIFNPLDDILIQGCYEVRFCNLD